MMLNESFVLKVAKIRCYFQNNARFGLRFLLRLEELFNSLSCESSFEVWFGTIVDEAGILVNSKCALSRDVGNRLVHEDV